MRPVIKAHILKIKALTKCLLPSRSIKEDKSTFTSGVAAILHMYARYDNQQGTYNPRPCIALRIYITLPFHNFFLNKTSFTFYFFGRISEFLLFVSLCLQRTHCFLSLTRTDSDVKMHCSQAIHSWLAMAPAREHTPHNNELLRPPEDTMPVQRIEIKRQVRREDWRRGKGGRSGGYEFNIQQMLNI